METLEEFLTEEEVLAEEAEAMAPEDERGQRIEDLLSRIEGLLEKIADGALDLQQEHTAVNVTSTYVTVLDNEYRRVYALLVNDSDATIYLSLGGTAAANTGIRLNANGGSYEISAKLGNLYTGVITAIHGSTGNKVCLVTEGIDASK